MADTAFRFESSRLAARCWSPADAPAFRALLDRNDDHLRPFIPWMRDEPQTLEQTRARLAGYEAKFLAGEDFRYALMLSGGPLIGELMLSTRTGGNTREVGYLVDRDATGRGYATEAAAMAIRVAFEVSEVDLVELHCSAQNVGSVRIAEKLGFRLDAVHPEDVADSEGILRDSMVWVLSRSDYPSTFSARVEVRAYARDGRQLL